ncbi:MAG: CBS domain-containing protein [Cytophagales bacterium]|nr:MAG: CBS domain-containing protein [Cytophagales bacterium]
MIASSFINLSIPAIKVTDTVADGLEYFEHSKLHWLPVIKDKHFEGMVSEEMLFDNDDQASISSIILQKSDDHIFENQHFFEALKTLHQSNTDVVAVLNLEEEYEGCISAPDLLNYYANIGFIDTIGGILVLSIKQHDYSLSEISRIVETNEMKVLALHVSDNQPDSYNIEVTLKLNKTDLSRLIASFERFGYQIVAQFHETSMHHHDADRFDALMRYLNV